MDMPQSKMEKVNTTDPMKAPVYWSRKPYRTRYSRDLDDSSSSEYPPSTVASTATDQLQSIRKQFTSSQPTVHQKIATPIRLLCLVNNEQREQFQITLCKSHGQEHLHIYFDSDVSFDTCNMPSMPTPSQNISFGKRTRKAKDALKRNTRSKKNNRYNVRMQAAIITVDQDDTDVSSPMSRLMMTTTSPVELVCRTERYPHMEDNEVTIKDTPLS